MTRTLHPLAIYVNASSANLRAASRGANPSTPIEEGKRWTSGANQLSESRANGAILPLIFAQYRELSYWAQAATIELTESGTLYSFVRLQPLSGHFRNDLIVDSSGSSLPNEFIRSYAIVRTPSFLQVPLQTVAEIPEELVGLEGEALIRMVSHRKREEALRVAKINEVFTRNGRLSCEVPGCSFDFAAVYGEPGHGYAHVHHLRPLAESAGPRETRLEDLAVVCANCHAIIHRGGGCRDLHSLIAR
jgi:hypothetical protein